MFILWSANALNLGLVENVIVWYRVNSFPTKPVIFTCLQYKSFVNIAVKGEIAHNQQFLLFQ